MWNRKFLTLLLLSNLVFWQSVQGNDNQPATPIYQLPSKAKQTDYQAGIIVVKLKPEHAAFFESYGISSQASKEALNEIGFQDANTIMPKPAIARMKAQRRSRPMTIDPGLYRYIRFDHETDVEVAINAIYRLGIVEYAEPLFVQKLSEVPNDPLINDQWYLENINAFDAWDVSKNSEDVVIAIVDSGVELNHPDLAGNIYINEVEIPDNNIDDDNDGYIDNYLGWDFAGADQDNLSQDNDPNVPLTGDDHGTAVAGCAAAIPNNAEGIAGVGYNAKILVTKHSADNQDPDDPSIFFAYSGVLYAINQGVDIINMSWGGSFFSQFAQDVMNLGAIDNDIVMVAAAGNDDSDELHYPSAYNHVLSVTGLSRGGIRDGQYGTTVDVAAPYSEIRTTTLNEDYRNIQGTSFSSPITAGAAALVKTHFPNYTALQIMEQLRVTANPDIYDDNPNFVNQLGIGRVDALAALTDSRPAIRASGLELLNMDGQPLQRGQTGKLTGRFINYLQASSGNLSMTVTTNSADIAIVNGSQNLGIINTLESVNLGTANSTIEIAINDRIGTNVVVDFLIEYSDGDYSDYEWFSVLVNPTFLNVNENQVSTSITSIGRIGYQDNNQLEGIGFGFFEENLLFEMGLMMGTSNSTISNTVRDAEGGYDDEFQVLEGVDRIVPGERSASEVFGSFNDGKAGSNLLEVATKYRSLVWRDEPDDQYIIVEYTLINNSGDPIDNYYVGLYADWDIGQNGQSDRAGWEGTYDMGYITGPTDKGNLYAGIQVLTGSPVYWAIDNDQDIAGTPWGVYDGFTDEEKWESLSSGIGRTEAGTQDGGNDVSHTVGAGPYSLAPDDSVLVAFALHGAISLADLQASAEAADQMYNQTLQATQPIVEDAAVCSGEPITLTATGATSFNWYTSKTGGEAVASGPNFTTGPLFNDTTFYVSNSEAAYESVRTPINVAIAPSTQVTVLGSTTLCEGDTVTLQGPASADTYLWSTGETTQSIEVTASGTYSVEVTNTTLGCSGTSEEIAISVNASPTADFGFSVNGSEVVEGTEVQFTDESTGAKAWNWNFGDGTTSTEQNPSHTYQDIDEYTITLKVRNPAGCTDEFTMMLTVVSSIPEALRLGGVSVYPNPSSGDVQVNIESEDIGTYQVVLRDVHGRIITEQWVEKTGRSMQVALAANALNKGFYLVDVQHNGKQAVLKLIKK